MNFAVHQKHVVGGDIAGHKRALRQVEIVVVTVGIVSGEQLGALTNDQIWLRVASTMP